MAGEFFYALFLKNNTNKPIFSHSNADGGVDGGLRLRERGGGGGLRSTMSARMRRRRESMPGEFFTTMFSKKY